jgi:hypothetical protein
VTDSPSRPSWTQQTEAPDPRDDPGMIRTFAGYRQALSQMTPDQLIAQLTVINAQLEAQSRSTLTALLSPQLSDLQRSLDNPVLRSPRTATPSSPADRGAAASRPSPALHQRSAVDLLAASKKLAPRIAAKLVASEARRARADRDG